MKTNFMIFIIITFFFMFITILSGKDDAIFQKIEVEKLLSNIEINSQKLISENFNLVYIGVIPKESINKINNFYKKEYRFYSPKDYFIVKFFKDDQVKIMLFASSEFKDIIFEYPTYKISIWNKIFNLQTDPIMPNFIHNCINITSFSVFNEFSKAFDLVDVFLKKRFSEIDNLKVLERRKKELLTKIEYFTQKQSKMKESRDILANENIIKIVESELLYIDKNWMEIINEKRDFYSSESISCIYVGKDGNIHVQNNNEFSLKYPRIPDGLDYLRINLIYIIKENRIEIIN